MVNKVLILCSCSGAAHTPPGAPCSSEATQHDGDNRLLPSVKRSRTVSIHVLEGWRARGNHNIDPVPGPATALVQGVHRDSALDEKHTMESDALQIGHLKSQYPIEPVASDGTYGQSSSSAIPAHSEPPPLTAPIHQCSRLNVSGSLDQSKRANDQPNVSWTAHPFLKQRSSASSAGFPYTAATAIRRFITSYFQPQRSPDPTLPDVVPVTCAFNSFQISPKDLMLPSSYNTSHRSTPLAGQLYFRPLTQSDLTQCEQLHREWFPLRYDEAFYSAITSGRVFSLAAVYKPSLQNGCLLALNRDANSTTEYIAGLITVSQEVGSHLRFPDVACVMGSAEAARLRRLSAPEPETPTETSRAVISGSPTTRTVDVSRHYRVKKDVHLAYILTIGVAEGFRGHGIAMDLVRRTVDYFVSQDNKMRALYLHVADYNQTAVRLYEKLGFRYLLRQPGYYCIQGESKDALLYALYLQSECSQPSNILSSTDWSWPSFSMRL